MAALEAETIILINEADKKSGYFHFFTSNPFHYSKLLKRVGLSNLIALKEDKARGRVVSWRAKVPIKFLSSTLGLRKLNPSVKPPRGRPFLKAKISG